MERLAFGPDHELDGRVAKCSPPCVTYWNPIYDLLLFWQDKITAKHGLTMDKLPCQQMLLLHHLLCSVLLLEPAQERLS